MNRSRRGQLARYRKQMAYEEELAFERYMRFALTHVCLHVRSQKEAQTMYGDGNLALSIRHVMANSTNSRGACVGWPV